MQNNEHYFNIDTNEYQAIKREIEITSRYPCGGNSARNEYQET